MPASDGGDSTTNGVNLDDVIPPAYLYCSTSPTWSYMLKWEEEEEEEGDPASSLESLPVSEKVPADQRQFNCFLFIPQILLLNHQFLGVLRRDKRKQRNPFVSGKTTPVQEVSATLLPWESLNGLFPF